MLIIALLALALTACHKAPEAAPAPPPAPAEQPANVPPNGGRPEPLPTPTEPVVMEKPDNMDAVLNQLTHELRRGMISHHYTGTFDDFVKATNVKPPPPPAGKKYAISRSWKIVLIDANSTELRPP